MGLSLPGLHYALRMAFVFFHGPGWNVGAVSMSDFPDWVALKQQRLLPHSSGDWKKEDRWS